MTKQPGPNPAIGNTKPDAMDAIKRVVKKTPVVRDLARKAMKWRAARSGGDFSSADYWESRYREGRNSGSGSYNRLAEFKADVINRFVAEHGVKSVIEFGCGDGSQLRLAEYPSYVGVDVSPTVIESTQWVFEADATKSFIHLDDVSAEHCSDLSMSLDVIYHLVEDEVFESHMRQLFNSARQYVIVYASNDDRPSNSVHVRHRRFTDWVKRNRPDFKQIGFVKNAYPESVSDIDNTSFADFYFFGKAPAVSEEKEERREISTAAVTKRWDRVTATAGPTPIMGPKSASNVASRTPSRSAGNDKADTPSKGEGANRRRKRQVHNAQGSR